MLELLDRASPTRSVVMFCRTLRSEGLSVSVPDTFTYIRALGVVGVREANQMYWAGRATLVRRPEDIEVYDRVFSQVVVLSDGWDRGDPDELGSQMARLHRVAHQIVWVNPLKATPGYEPLTQGMAAALPHIDRFLPGHNVASMQTLLEVLTA